LTTAQLVFVVIGGVGLAVLLGSLLLGDAHLGDLHLGDLHLGDVHAGDLHAGAEAHAGTDSGATEIPSFFSLSVISSILVGFGLAGYLTLWGGVPLVAAVFCAIAGGVLLGFVVYYGLIRPLAKQQSSDMLGRQTYAGSEAVVTLRIPADGGFGEVSFVDSNGARVNQCAWPHDKRAQAIPDGTKVLIIEVTPDGVTVTPLDENL
jgi:hypothetical protein